ncbi:MAG: hypothetical protein AB1806_10695 [Acidobacteriota bacterium]
MTPSDKPKSYVGWMIESDRAAGVVFATAACLPFLETFLYNAHVGAGLQTRAPFDYLTLGLLVVLLWLLMIVAFLIDPATARHILQRAQVRSRHMERRVRRRAVWALFALPLALAGVILAGSWLARLLSWFDLLQALILPFLQLVCVALLVWFVGALLRAAADLRDDLVGAMGAWAFCLRVSTRFYLLLTVATILVSGVEGIRPDAQLEFRLAIAKDYLLLFIIAGMLYLGLFRLGAAQRLASVFGSLKGLLQFIIVCGVIAILAIWADFNSMSPDRQNAAFHYRWQRQYNVWHVYVRDIRLLLLPIAGLLYWTLRRVSRELDRRGRAALA